MIPLRTIRAVALHGAALLLYTSLLSSPAETAIGWVFSVVAELRRRVLRRVLALQHRATIDRCEPLAQRGRTTPARVWVAVRMLRIKQLIARVRVSR